jgi:hypothetical protein
MFEKEVEIVQKKIVFPPSKDDFNKNLAFQHLHDVGGTITPDVLSPHEEDLIRG